ncbi:MAG: glycine cleavage system protein GcvH [Candidatus Neptunochlamydia sp.]|nr:glycine cleavage system protein GcvH [Candidatus Neptunochlamydia sp.]
MKKFAETHEWIDINEGKGRVGISTHAQKELGEIVYVELPKVGQEIKVGEEVAVLESTKAAADIYSPVSGKIIGVNEKVKKDPSLMNKFPEGEGYLFEITLTHPEESELLTSKDEYHQWIVQSTH